MRIGMVTYAGFPPDIRIENEAKTLVKAGHDVIVIANEYTSRIRVHQLDGICVRYVRFPSAPFPLASPFHFRKTLKNCDLDVLHMQDAPASSPVMMAAKTLSLKTVLDLHEAWPLLRFYDPKLRGKRLPLGLAHVLLTSIEDLLSTRMADAVITIVEEMSDYYRKACRVPRDKMHVLKNVVDLSGFRDVVPAKLPPGGFYVTYLGGMESYVRNLEPLILAAKLLSDLAEVKFLMVGDGAYRPVLEQLAERLGVQGNIVFTGRVPRNTALSYLLASDVCVLPHLKTPLTDMGLPHKLTQYFAARKPVVSTPLDPVVRMFRKAIYLWQPTTPERLSEILRDLYSDSGLRQSLAETGQSLVREEYNWEIEKRRLLRVYESIA
jgi:glycosyltransferase involved in cell wall biosynthesis